jgi:hypothetical protein
MRKTQKQDRLLLTIILTSQAARPILAQRPYPVRAKKHVTQKPKPSRRAAGTAPKRKLCEGTGKLDRAQSRNSNETKPKPARVWRHRTQERTTNEASSRQMNTTPEPDMVSCAKTKTSADGDRPAVGPKLKRKTNPRVGKRWPHLTREIPPGSSGNRRIMVNRAEELTSAQKKV